MSPGEDALSRLREKMGVLRTQADKVPQLEANLAANASQARKSAALILELQSEIASLRQSLHSVDPHVAALTNVTGNAEHVTDAAVQTEIDPGWETALTDRDTQANSPCVYNICDNGHIPHHTRGRPQESPGQEPAAHRQCQTSEVVEQRPLAPIESAEGCISDVLAAGLDRLRSLAQTAEVDLAGIVQRLVVAEHQLRLCDARATKLSRDVILLREANGKQVAGVARMRSERESLLAGMRELLPSKGMSTSSDASGEFHVLSMSSVHVVVIENSQKCFAPSRRSTKGFAKKHPPPSVVTPRVR